MYELPTMKLFNRHKAIINTSFALLFFITNSGFTAIIESCRNTTMENMSCCAAEVKGGSKRCDCGDKQNGTVNGLSYQGNSVCHSSKVVGGSLNLQALLEKSLSSSNEKLLSSTTLTFVSITSNVIETTKSSLFSSSFLSISSPSVEKCVLYSTFLI